MSKEKFESVGTLYAVSNVAIAGLIRIGATKKKVEERLKELYNTSVPYPFLLECSVKVHDLYRVESTVHNLLKTYRVNSSRDFYAIKPKIIKDLFKCLGDENKSVYKKKENSEFIKSRDMGEIVDINNNKTVAELLQSNKILCGGSIYGFHQFMNLIKKENIELDNLEINNQKLDEIFEELYSK